MPGSKSFPADAPAAEGAVPLGLAVHAVPVKAGALYYLLSLFCRAMARGLPGSSVAEVLALVEASNR